MTKNDFIEQEKKDRFVAENCLNHLLRKGTDLKIKGTDLYNAVDLKCSVINSNNKKVPFNVEIKERFKDENQLKRYPNAELKVKKLNRMRRETPKGTKLYYMVLLNEKECLMFDLDKLDWSNIELKNWVIKRTQLDPNSDLVVEPTYFIPYDMARVKMDCSGYFKEYYN